jgi:hypothetical protein
MDDNDLNLIIREIVMSSTVLPHKVMGINSKIKSIINETLYQLLREEGIDFD